MPVVGDQGVVFAPINFINMIDKKHKIKFNLLIGKRDFDNIEEKIKDIPNAFYFESKKKAKQFIVNKLLKNKIVNVFHGNMEFGPRALCNTSTLAIPLKSNYEYINILNGRNGVMPMAPVVLKENVNLIFKEHDSSKIFDETMNYMIITMDYKINDYNYKGVMHNYPIDTNRFSGRPQVVDDKTSLIYHILKDVDLLANVKMLINTSFNVHGNPIVYTIEDAIKNYKQQLSMASNKKDVYLVIIK
jgi:carbamoyltransferase